MGDRIYAKPDELDGAARTLDGIVTRYEESLNAIGDNDMPAMPAEIASRVNQGINLILNNLRDLAVPTGLLAVQVRATAERFRKTADNPELGVALTLIDRENLLPEAVLSSEPLPGEKPWEVPNVADYGLDGAVGALIARFERATRFEILKADKNGVYRPYTNFTPANSWARSAGRLAYWGEWAKKFIPGLVPDGGYKLGTYYGGQGSNQSIPKVRGGAAAGNVAKILGRVGAVASGIISGFNEYQQNTPNLTLTDDEVLGRAAAAGFIEGAGAFAGGLAGASVGASIGALGGPAAPITVPLGGLIGGVLGAFGGGQAAKITHEMILGF